MRATKTVAVAAVAAGLTAAVLTSGEAAQADPRAAGTVVRTDLGVLRGASDGSVRSWLGVPYAAPPEGELRWESPQPAAAWKGVRRATEFGSACAQGETNMPAVPSTDEDCLYLNVYAPERVRRDLPVMVWFHGGGNTYGAGEQYDPSMLVSDGRTVVVTVNYRQGLFANMAHPALDDDGTTSGNYGLEDQQAALRWVRDNAGAFGGDEDNVTIFGESGGGYDVCAHLTSPTSEGLFDKAIMQSSPCTADWAQAREAARTRDIAYADDVCPADSDVEACLRDLTPAELNAATAGLYEVQPVIGGPVMPVPTADAIAAGDVADVPVLIGINRDEEQLMTAGIEVLSGHVMTAEEYYPALVEQFGADAEAIVARYPLSDYENPAKALAAVQTDAYWAEPLATTVDRLAEQVPTYAYELSVSGTPYFPWAGRPSWELDAFHMVDVAFLFDTTIFERRAPEVEPLSELMVDSWSTFARAGDPDGRGPWREARRDRVRQLTAEGARTVDFADEHRIQFWRGLSA